jgi:rare lipoprotein A
VNWATGRAYAAALALLLAACQSAPPSREKRAPPTQYVPAQPPSTAQIIPPIPPESVPDAIPRSEPKSRYGNPPFYVVFGKRYYVLAASVGYVERGVASWYGPGFHEERTSTGEPYDMFGMTAAHKTLPLPAFVRVTNLQNGRSVVVRVNDRGPFVGNRIIDLSYTAAAKLDMLRNGTAIVEVRAIDPSMPAEALTAAAVNPPVATPTGLPAIAAGGLYIQAGAFSDPSNADRLMAKLRSGGFNNVFVRQNTLAGRTLFRVRIGPVPDVAEFDRIVTALEVAGVNDAHLALD